jgi:hypothetical protein
MVDERAIALDNITSKNKKYKKLSDGTVIGIDILNDLGKYAELKLKKKYKININRWLVHSLNKITDSTHEINNDELKSLLAVKYNQIKNEKSQNSNDNDMVVDIITLDGDSSLSDKFKKYITYNSVIKIETVDDDKYLTPSIYDNDDPKEIAIADNDLMILNKIFKTKYSKSIDDMVLNSFYKEFNDKLDSIKTLMLENNNSDKNDIIKSIKEDLYDKLFAIYNIQKYQLSTQINKDLIRSIDDRANKYSALNYKIIGGGEDEVTEVTEDANTLEYNLSQLHNVILRDAISIRAFIKDKVPKLKRDIYERDVKKIIKVANKIKLHALDVAKKSSKKNFNFHNELINQKETAVKHLYETYDNYKKKLINMFDKDNKDNKKLYSSDIFLDADIYSLNNDTTSDKYAVLLNYIQSLKNKKKYGGASNLNNKNDIVDNIFDNKARLKLFNDLKKIYMSLITNYYKIIDEAGEEEKEYNFLFDTENLKEDNKNTTELYKFLRKYNDQLYNIIEELKRKLLIANKSKKKVGDNIEDYEAKLRDISLHKSSVYDDTNIKDGIKNELSKLKLSIRDLADLKSNTKYFETIIDKILGIINNNNNNNIKEEISKLNIDNDFSTLKSIIENRLFTSEDVTTPDKEAIITNKKNNIRKRIKILTEVQPEIKKALETLFSKINSLNKINLSEYEEFTKHLLQSHKLTLFEENNNDHIILKNIINEKRDLEEKETKLTDEIKIYDKIRRDKENSLKLLSRDGLSDPKVREIKGGNEIKNEYIYDISKQSDLDTFKQKHYNLHDLLITNNSNNDDKIKYNFGNFMLELKNNIKDLESNQNLNDNTDNTDNIKSDIFKKSNVDDEKNIYESVWKDYNNGLTSIRNKTHTAMSNIEENEYLHDKVIVNNLDPELVLKINFQDKAIFLLLVFIIRTISVVILEFLIEHNIIKTLHGSIVFYGFTYLFILFLVVFLVNYDSYKLRILLNYLNIHINSSNLILQNILFIIFIVLIFILVKSDDILKYFGYGFDYTNIYGSIYDYRSSFDEEYDSNLSNSEKLKLLYRTDILSMIIFIFTGFLVLIL